MVPQQCFELCPRAFLLLLQICRAALGHLEFRDGLLPLLDCLVQAVTHLAELLLALLQALAQHGHLPLSLHTCACSLVGLQLLLAAGVLEPGLGRIKTSRELLRV